MTVNRDNSAVFDARRRDEVLDEIGKEAFDLIIVGGGINGAGVAHDATLRGLKVAVVEQHDLAFGTSSRSSKLIHGGLRYLEHYHFKLVFEGTNERAALRKVAPHLVRPLLFALPVYEGSRHPLWKMDIGLWLYDGLSLFKAEKRHMTLRSPKRMLEREPLLRADGLQGGIIYYDCITDDARLTLENAIAAARGGAYVLTHAKVTGVTGNDEHSEEVTVHVTDQISGHQLSLRGKGIVNCTGVWTDSVRQMADVDETLIRPTKGVHLVLKRDRLMVNHAAALLTPQDGRVFFAIPWHGRTVIGTTDTDDDTDPSKLFIDAHDVEYLLEAANHSFPGANLTPDDVLAGWVGLRPLIHVETENASDVPREHQIYRDGKMVTIAGGKLTTYRRMAAETVDAAAQVIGAQVHESTSEDAKLPGAIDLTDDFDDLAQKLTKIVDLPGDVAMRLANVYGSRASTIVEYAKADASLAERVCPERDVILAEIVHSVEHELAVTLEDVLVRRTSIALTADDQGLSAAPNVARLMGARLGWDQARTEAELAAYAEAVALTRKFRDELEAVVDPDETLEG